MMKLYKGELGEFLYNDSIFRIENNITGDSLRYIGNGEKIQLPDGLISCREMFKDCIAKKLDFSIIDTSNIKDFSFMFTDSNIKEIDLTNFDFKNGEDFAGMFTQIFSSSYNDGVLRINTTKPNIILPEFQKLSEGVLKELCYEEVIIKDDVYYFKQKIDFDKESTVNHLTLGEMTIIQKINDGTYLMKRETNGEYVATIGTEYFNKYTINNNNIAFNEGITWGQGKYLGNDIFAIDFKKLERDLNFERYTERENNLKKNKDYMCKKLYESFDTLTNDMYKDIINKDVIEKAQEEKEDLFYRIEDIRDLEYDLSHSKLDYITDKLEKNINKSNQSSQQNHIYISNNQTRS